MPDHSRLEAELLREALGAAAHDLGGVASAMGLRLDALGPSPTADEVRAIGGIVEEVRTLGRQLRQLRGPRGGGALAPARSSTLRSWWSLVERFGRALLGRGVALEGSVDDAELPPEHFHALTFGVLALCRGIRERELAHPSRLTVTTKREGNAVVVSLTLHGPDGAPLSLTEADDPWAAYGRDTLQVSPLAIHEAAPALRVMIPTG